MRFYSLRKVQLSGVLADAIETPTTYHGDWVIDEIYLSKTGFPVHEIEFSFGVFWKIYFSDIEFDIAEV